MSEMDGPQQEQPSPAGPVTLAYSRETVTPDKVMAIGALILGLVSIFPCVGILAGIAAVIVGIVSLATGRPGRGMAIAGIVLGLLVPLLQMSILGGTRESVRQAVCKSSLMGVRNAVEMYKADNGYETPANLQLLVQGKLILPQMLRCPSTGNTTGVDYFYFFHPNDVPAKALVACDLPGNHGDSGRNVLFADASGKFYKESAFQILLTKPENIAFAKALKAREAAMPKVTVVSLCPARLSVWR